MCYPQNCVIHTLPPLLFILCAKHTKPHHPQNDKQNLESTNFLEALVKFDESCKKVNVAQQYMYYGKMGVYTTPQNIHIPRSEVSLSSVFCCNAFSLHYYASESENRIACYPICPMGRKLSPHKLLGSLYFLEKEKIRLA